MSNGEQPKATTCPNCQQPAIREGNEIACEACDAVFIVKKKQGAKVKTVGKFEDHENRISRLEHLHDEPTGPQQLPGEEPKPTEDEDDDL